MRGLINERHIRQRKNIKATLRALKVEEEQLGGCSRLVRYKSCQRATEGASANTVIHISYMTGSPEPLFALVRPESALAMAASPGRPWSTDSVPLPSGHRAITSGKQGRLRVP